MGRILRQTDSFRDSAECEGNVPVQSVRPTHSDAVVGVPTAQDDRAADVPAYLRETYTWAYLNSLAVALFDHPWVVSAILFGNYRRLQQTCFDELEPGFSVLQAACAYGDLSEKLAKCLGPRGSLDVVDVAEIQVVNCQRKLKPFPHARAFVADAATLPDASYDMAISFFLLHEMPDDYKRAVVNALLRSVRPGGKVVFVDYHKPHVANPLKGLMSLVFDTLEPYAKSLWHNDIAALANTPDRFEWHKQTYFGGLYQKVVARCRGASAPQAVPVPHLDHT